MPRIAGIFAYHSELVALGEADVLLEDQAAGPAGEVSRLDKKLVHVVERAVETTFTKRLPWWTCRRVWRRLQPPPLHNSYGADPPSIRFARRVTEARTSSEPLEGAQEDLQVMTRR